MKMWSYLKMTTKEEIIATSQNIKAIALAELANLPFIQEDKRPIWSLRFYEPYPKPPLQVWIEQEVYRVLPVDVDVSSAEIEAAIDELYYANNDKETTRLNSSFRGAAANKTKIPSIGSRLYDIERYPPTTPLDIQQIAQTALAIYQNRSGAAVNSCMELEY